MKKFLQTSLTAFFIFYSALFYGQNHEIKGTVTTENGTPLEFVTITVKETKSNSITDSSGSFTINTTTNATKLIISLYDETSNSSIGKDKKIADKCLELWDIMFEKQLGSVREISRKLMER